MENEEERRGGRRGRRQAGKQVPDGASKLMSTVVFCARYIAEADRHRRKSPR